MRLLSEVYPIMYIDAIHYSVLNGLKNCGVKDRLIICADRLTGIKEAIATAFPKIKDKMLDALEHVTEK